MRLVRKVVPPLVLSVLAVVWTLVLARDVSGERWPVAAVAVALAAAAAIVALGVVCVRIARRMDGASGPRPMPTVAAALFALSAVAAVEACVRWSVEPHEAALGWTAVSGAALLLATLLVVSHSLLVLTRRRKTRSRSERLDLDGLPSRAKT